MESIQDIFDAEAEKRPYWKGKNAYYYREVTRYLKGLIPEGARVLEIGSGDGELLNALKPSVGLGIDASPRFVAQSRTKFPHLDFREGLAEDFRLAPHEKFDVIVLSHLVGYLKDVQAVFENLHQASTPSTRIIINYYNYLWEPVLEIGGRFGLNMREKLQNWLSLSDLDNLFYVSGFETIKKFRKLLFPVHVPLVSVFMNRCVANLPFFRKFCLAEFIVARPKRATGKREASVSVVVACKNEKGNIEELVRRIPDFVSGSEIIFVDGKSTDGTPDEIRRVMGIFPHKKIRLLNQDEPSGKGGAVRIGFENAEGEILVILDADISVAPEDLVKFCDLLQWRTGEFINGTRLVYPMEKQAMRFLNIIANKFFSVAFTYLLEQRIKDTLCGTKALFKSDYEKLAQNRVFFGEFDPFGDFDLLFGASKLNLKIVEVPVRYYERRYGTTKINRFRHGVLLLGMCLIAIRKLKFI